MRTQEYYIELDELGYNILNSKGVVATFGILDDAYAAMRDFENKAFPEGWQKTPPAMRNAKRRFYSDV